MRDLPADAPGASLPDLPPDFVAACATLEARLADVPIDLLPEAAAAVAGTLERVRTRAMLRFSLQVPAASHQRPVEEHLTTSQAAKLLNRTRDWFGRHRRDYASAVVSRPGQRARYSRQLLERCLSRQNRANTRID